MEKNKKLKPTPLYRQNAKVTNAEEAEVMFSKSVKVIPSVKDFTYSEFKKLADNTPFTQAEWAAMLHVSERTLQRYAKNNSSFAPINAERFVQIHHVLTRGKKVLGNIESFYDWIHSNPPMLEGDLSFESLTSFDGLQRVLSQIGRIEHGILA
ncbi:MAG: antitoxin Xre-like helix-turn-helix domain-containing protein [Ferruginibacter sp.]